MKKNLILSSLLLTLAACETAKRTPYLGGVGEYGYTYDLNNSPSPFVDTSYRPLTVRDLSGPIMVTATGRVAVAVLEQQAAESKTNSTEIISTPNQAATNAVPSESPENKARTNSPEAVVPIPNPPEIPAVTNPPPVTPPPAQPPVENPENKKPTTPP